MRYATISAASYCGIDLHARTMYVVVLDQQGQVRLEKSLPARPDAFLAAIEPFRPDLAVACECVHTWYWLADLCAEHQVPFVLGHALGLRAVHQSKTKSDAHDALTIARLLKGGNFPLAYPYPKERRGLRDLLRARLRFVRLRARTYGHVHAALRQLNLPDAHVRRAVAAELELLDPLDALIRRQEADLEEATTREYPREMALLQSIPGVGPVLSMTVLLEIDTI